MNSLRSRVVAVASLVLAAFLGVTAVALERAFRETGLELVRERLEAQAYALLALAEPGPDGGFSVGGLAEPRYSLPESGLYAQIRAPGGAVLWSSQSLLGRDLDPAPPREAGVAEFGEAPSAWGERLFTLGYRVRWELRGGGERVLDLLLAESRTPFDTRVSHFRRSMWVWLGGLAVVLLLAQAAVLGWGLAPIRRLSRQVREVEEGQRDSLSEDHPRELAALVANLNHLIGFGRRTIERHRNAVADLAHALKTPLAVIRGAAEDHAGNDARLRDTLLDSVARMDEALSYRLRRASLAGETTLGPPAPVAPVVERLAATLEKVYADKQLTLDVDAGNGLRARIDPGDLTEILGNLMDNACKWANARVAVAVAADPSGGLRIRVTDDGPGIPAEQRARILERGVRGDEQMPGQGLGLALVRELVEDYGGDIHFADATPVGTEVSVRLAVRSA